MKTLILSKDSPFDIVFCEIFFKVRQLLVDPHMAQNQKWQKQILLIFVPPSFFLASLICSAYNIDLWHLFWASFANSCHFELYSSRIRSFPAILSKFEKWSFLAQKSMLFSRKSKFSVLGLTNKDDWRVQKEKYAQKYF